MAMACSQPRPIVVNDTVYIYYAALNFAHDADPNASAHYSGGVALATLKRDRFASLETGTPDAGPCRVITRPFVVRHPRLYLNAATWQQGAIRVEALTRDWSYNEVREMRDAVPAKGINAEFRNGTLRDVAREVLALSRQGLRNRGKKNRDGYDETSFLTTLDEVVARGTTSAEEMLNAYHTRWGGSIEPAFLEYAY